MQGKRKRKRSGAKQPNDNIPNKKQEQRHVVKEAQKEKTPEQKLNGDNDSQNGHGDQRVADNSQTDDNHGAMWLVKKLRARIDTEEASLEKVTLAAQLFHSSEMIMFNKDFFLLQWLLQTMSHSEKRAGSEVRKEVNTR